jgi:undecaprenyl-diphosphatase
VSLAQWLDLDARLSQRLRLAETPSPLRNLAAVLAHSGDSWFWLAGLAAVWLLGDAEWKRTAAWLAAAIVITAALVLVVKFSVRRARPAGEWGAVYRKTDPHSFPSGHAVRAAMLAVLGASLGPPWFGMILILWAPLVAFARIAMGVHYLSDVLAGIVLGIAIGAAFGVLIP